MILDFANSKPLQYLAYLLLFTIGQCFSMWGQYVSLPYKNLTYYQSLTMCLPFAWIDWFFMTFAVDIGNTHNLVTPTQNIFLLIILQFTLVLLINNFYLKQNVYRSDIFAFVLLLAGYFVSFFHIFSKLLGVTIPEHKHQDDPSQNIENFSQKLMKNKKSDKNKNKIRTDKTKKKIRYLDN